MFGFIQPIKFSDRLTVDAFDTRRDGDQVNFDIARVTTVDEDGEELTTQFGIQGRSDHLAKTLRQRRDGVKPVESTDDTGTNLQAVA